MNTDPTITHPVLSDLTAANRRLDWIARHPAYAVYAAVIASSALGWLYLSLMVIGSPVDPASLGPGMQIFEGFSGLRDSPVLLAICRPIGLSGLSSFTAQSFFLTFAMWAMMVLAMMLPTAAPMLATYATLADTAAKKSEPAAPVWVLAAGYSSVWFGFSVIAAAAQILLSAAGSLTPAATPVSSVLAGTVLLAAAAYQFTPAKHACLTKCRNPFMFFFTNWTARASGIFRIGVIQGLFCLGCCWALMAVMFAVGVMNLVWIALLCILMVIEKSVSSPWMSRSIGLFLCGLALLLLAPVLSQIFGIG